MKKEEWIEAMDAVEYDLNSSKDKIWRAADDLREKGMNREADALMKIVYKIEYIQNKYNRYS